MTPSTRARGPAEPPEILIELFLEDIDDLAALKDTNNSLRESAPCVKIRIAFNADYIDEYAAYIENPTQIVWARSCSVVARLSDRAAAPDPVGHAGSRPRSAHHQLARSRNGR
jgi:hypothetical protein